MLSYVYAAAIVVFFLAICKVLHTYFEKDDDFESKKKRRRVDTTKHDPHCAFAEMKMRSSELEAELDHDIDHVNRDAINKKFQVLLKLSEEAYYRANYEVETYPQLEYATKFYNRMYSLWFNSQFCEETLVTLREDLKEFRENLE